MLRTVLTDVVAAAAEREKNTYFFFPQVFFATGEIQNPRNWQLGFRTSRPPPRHCYAPIVESRLGGSAKTAGVHGR